MPKVFKQRPYFDDYDENKKFLNVAFVASRALGCRELNTLQSILQNQIERMGDHVFREGEKVLDGAMSFDTSIRYVKLTNGVRNPGALIGQVLTGSISGAKGYVVYYTDSENEDPATLFVRFVSSNPESGTGEWLPGEQFEEITSVGISDSTDAIGIGSIAQIQRGIYYVHGYFVLVDEQTIVLDKYENTPSYRIGLMINESIVTEEDDSSLLDNANGSYNYAAPGAHRFKIDLVLTKVDLSSKTDNDQFLELGQIQNGRIISQNVKTGYSDLEKTLARRTYDESGDYTVRAFKGILRPHRSNDRKDWKENTSYSIGDVVKNLGNSYTCVSAGKSGEGNGPNVTKGIFTDNTVIWEYTKNPSFNNGVYPAEGMVTKIEIVDGGNGYITPPLVLIESDSGHDATGTAIISQGKVIDVIIDNQGSGYLAGDATVRFVGGFATETLNDNQQICYNANDAPVTAVGRAILDSGDSSKLAFGLESGKAYVRGFEIEKVGTTWLGIDRARTTDERTSALLSPSIGSYFVIENVVGCPPLSKTGETINLLNCRVEDIEERTNSVIGTCKLRGMEWDSGTLHSGSEGKYRLYVYDVNLNRGYSLTDDLKGFEKGSFKCNVSPTLTQLTGSISLSESNKIEGSGTSFRTDLKDGDYIKNSNGTYYQVKQVDGQNHLTVKGTAKCSNVAFYKCTAQLINPQNLGMIFNLPNSYVKTLMNSSIDYTTMQLISNGVAQPTPDGVQITFSTSATNYVFANPEESDNLILIDTTNNDIVPFTVNGGGVASSSITLTVSGTNRQSHTFSLLATIRKSGVGIARKTKTSKFTTINVTSEKDVTNNSISLGVVDGYRLLSVIQYGSVFGETGNIDTSVAGIDITDRYQLVTGQTDCYYGISSIELKRGYTPPSGPIQISFYYFDHGTIGDYYSVDSYENILYDDIPSYKGTSLRDVLDFRPDITSSSSQMMIKSGTEIELGYEYYLARSDGIVLDYLGNFVNTTGVPSLNPVSPDVPSLSMKLYDLELAPYTTDETCVNVIMTDNKRYTMRDIGHLENRVERLEQYTTLSLLEAQTENLEITDEDGLSRFKQGFVVDNFKTGTLQTTSDSGLHCSFDNENGICRPPFTQNSFGLSEYVINDSVANHRASNNYRAYGKVYTLPLDPITPHVPIVEQPLASRIVNVNPFAVAAFIGKMAINPSSDDWFETKYLPDNVTQVEGNYTQLKNSLEGTKWNGWQTSWTGQVQTTFTGTTTLKEGDRFYDTAHQGWRDGRWWDHATSRNDIVQDHYMNSQQIGQVRTGIKTTVTATTDYQQVGDRLVSTTSIPYMRSRWILVKVKSLKPFTRYYPYFDNVNVDYWCTPASVVEIKDQNAEFDSTHVATRDQNAVARKIVTTKYSYWPELTDRTCLDVGDVIVGRQSGLSAVVVGSSQIQSKTNSNNITKALYVVNIKNGEKAVEGDRYVNGELVSKGETFLAGEMITASNSISQATATVTYAEGNKNHEFEPLISNDSGELYFVFWIPDESLISYTSSNNPASVVKFRCGDRVFSLSESATGSDNSPTSTVYSATGILNTRQKDINAVRNAVVSYTNVTENRTITNNWVSTSEPRSQVTVLYYDPIAQTFITGVKGGCFISKVDVYFAHKPGTDNPLPITLQIRPCENGLPSSKVLPFSEVTLRPDQVNLSNTSIQYVDDNDNVITTRLYDTPTTFEFESPVYVEDTSEYAIVLLSDSTEYDVWVGQVGDVVPGTQNYISKQPYAGVLLKSSNASTWTPDQNQDLKMTVYRANFKVADTSTNSPIIGDVEFAINNPKPKYLESNCFQTSEGSSLVRVFAPFHGLIAGLNAVLDYNNLNSVEDNTILSGTISLNNTTTTVFGTNTQFTEQLNPGDVLYDVDGNEIGTIRDIISDTELRLQQIPLESQTNIGYAIQAESLDCNGIPYSKLIGPFKVVSANLNDFIIDTGVKATSTGYGGDGYFTLEQLYNYDLIQPNITMQNFSETTTSLSIQGVSGTSSGSTDQVDLNTIPVTINENNRLSESYAIWNNNNRLNQRRPSLLFHARMMSSNPCLSPIIDGDRVSAILINNIIDNPTEETVNNKSLDQLVLSSDAKIGYYGGVEDCEIINSGMNIRDIVLTFSEPDGISVTNGGTTAKAIANIDNGRVSSITIVNKGVGYLTTPRLTIDVTALPETSATKPNLNVKMLYNQIIGTKSDRLDNVIVGESIVIKNEEENTKFESSYHIIDREVNDNAVILFVEKSLNPTATVPSETQLIVNTNWVDEISPTGGSTYSKYITKPIQFSGTCNVAKIMMGVFLPKISYVDVYCKGWLSNDNRSYNDIPWTKVKSDSNIDYVDKTSLKFQDVEYTYSGETFDTISVKVVMRGNDSNSVPMIRDFRLIACL